jgi:hypothetical protein
MEKLASLRDEELCLPLCQLPSLESHLSGVKAAIRVLEKEGVPQELADALGQCVSRLFCLNHCSVHQRFSAVVCAWERHGADGLHDVLNSFLPDR